MQGTVTLLPRHLVESWWPLCVLSVGFFVSPCLFLSLSLISTGKYSAVWHDLFPTDLLLRYYEKSIIEQAIIQQRSNSNNHWDETKRSIREARYRLSLQSDLGAGEPKHSQNNINGVAGNYKTQTTRTPKVSYQSVELISPVGEF